jgi:hypothetical protein
VDLVQVDVVGAQAAEAGVDAVEDVFARLAHVVGARAHAAVEFGGDDQRLAVEAQALDRRADEPLALALVVHVGRVQEVHAGVHRATQLTLDGLGAEAADDLPEALAAVGHGAQAEFRDEEAGVAEAFVLHVLLRDEAWFPGRHFNTPRTAIHSPT